MKTIQNSRDKKRALDILEKAFCCSPGMAWMVGGQKGIKKMRPLLSMFIREAVLKEGAFLTNDDNGVVLFFPLDKKRNSISLFCQKLYVFLFIVGIRRGLQAIKYKKMVSSIRPASGWLGWLVATDANAPGNAAAYEIKNWMFRRSDETQQPIYVETTIPRVRLLYLAAGYKEYASVKHPYQDINVWFMKREHN